VIPTLVRTSFEPYYNKILEIFDDDKDFIKILRDKKDTDFLDTCKTDFFKIWCGLIDWMASLVKPEVFDEILSLLVGFIFFTRDVK